MCQRLRSVVTWLSNLHISSHSCFDPNNCYLEYSPTGVFVATKDINFYDGYIEGRGRLGYWLASWFKRVSTYPRSPLGPRRELPFLPVLLAVAGYWELHLAFDDISAFRVYGPIHVGETWTLDGAYKLLAVLRILCKDWIAGEFRTWVETLINNHPEPDEEVTTVSDD
ncbi:uncharacterized protein F4822DRAFT_9857 [Hypoxylon trugodes]|uniref:uncharacterized protein n=1 Tax=Hypoxylon trugodes TaxID=326681 RepID=UPI00218C9B4B|nr:uncharacterized protein F4822DRAFT_9857 [Hypoxylon trugodes]KAI1393380.1 hypothetical protein F4822DRAFT_9857 [Hypoxylon trugodes]